MDQSKKYLLIFESPQKAREIAQFSKELGWNNIYTTASIGHVTKLADSGEDAIGVLDWNSMLLDWEIDDSKVKTVNNIVKMAKSVDEIYLATDPDREGEAIAYHLANVLRQKGIKKPIKRIRLSSITKAELIKNMENPTDIDMNMANAAIARAVTDKTVGYKISRKLWRNVPGAKSGGRAQSPILGMLCEREAERNGFKSSFTYNFKTNNDILSEKFDIYPDAEKKIFEEKGINLKHTNRKETNKTWNGNQIFDSTSADAVITGILHISTAQLSEALQHLYEKGYITYLRTDSKRIDPQTEVALKEELKKLGWEYVPIKAEAGAQDGHPGITPTDEKWNTNSKPSGMNELDWAVFNVIKQNTILAGIAAMKYTTVKDDFEDINTNTKFTISKSYLDERNVDKQIEKFEETNQQKFGTSFWKTTSMSKNTPENKDQILKKTAFNSGEWEVQENESKPKPSYTEKSLLKDLKKLGIGRPSTLLTKNNLMNVNVQRGYVDDKNGKLIPNQLGIAANKWLKANESEWDNVEWTAWLESQLDDIEKGLMDWKELCKYVLKMVSD